MVALLQCNASITVFCSLPVLTSVNLQQKHEYLLLSVVSHKRYPQAAITKPLPNTNSMRRQWPARAASGATTFSRPLRPTTRGRTRQCMAPGRREAAGHRAQVLQESPTGPAQGLDKPPHQGGGRGRFPDKRGKKLQPLRQHAAAWTVDSITVQPRRPC